jgi:hypothetical protein
LYKQNPEKQENFMKLKSLIAFAALAFAGAAMAHAPPNPADPIIVAEKLDDVKKMSLVGASEAVGSASAVAREKISSGMLLLAKDVIDTTHALVVVNVTLNMKQVGNDSGGAAVRAPMIGNAEKNGRFGAGDIIKAIYVMTTTGDAGHHASMTIGKTEAPRRAGPISI